jgi:hypothetical protein
MAKIHSAQKNEQTLYCDAIYYVRLLWFNKNHKFDICIFNRPYGITQITYGEQGQHSSGYRLFVCIQDLRPVPPYVLICPK